LPLVDQDRPLAFEQASRVGPCHGKLDGVVQALHCLGPLQGRAGLADTLRTFDGDGREVANELVQLVIDDAPLVRTEGAHAA
jgi:hypothetical protein